MVRFLFPVIPFMLIYAGYFLVITFPAENASRKSHYVPAMFAALVLATILPTHAFINARLDIAKQNGMLPVYEMFRRSDLKEGLYDMQVQNQILKDFLHVTATVSEDAKVMYYLPSYIALLSSRTGIKAPEPGEKKSYREIAEKHGVDYVFLTRMHPRHSRAVLDNVDTWVSIRGWTSLVWCSEIAGIGNISCLHRTKTTK
jgi:hypothetical protein